MVFEWLGVLIDVALLCRRSRRFDDGGKGNSGQEQPQGLLQRAQPLPLTQRRSKKRRFKSTDEANEEFVENIDANLNLDLGLIEKNASGGVVGAMILCLNCPCGCGKKLSG